MADNEYTYAVARIRSKELTLLNSQAVEQLLACKTYEECLHILADRGWDTGTSGGAEGMLAAERDKTWSLIAELAGDTSEFNVFLYTNDFHNLKAAIKQVCMQTEVPHIFFSHGTVAPNTILKAVQEHDFSRLPKRMQAAGQEAFDTLLHTHDGQRCDVIIDRAALESVYAAGKESENEVIREYAELTVAEADIRIAVRAARTGKKLEFLERALAPCHTLDVKRLAHAAVSGINSICDYLTATSYDSAVPALKESLSAFERWCDNLLIRRIRPQKYNPFTVAPLAAYLLARENEIKIVRIILSGKLNQLSDVSVRERVRETYV